MQRSTVFGSCVQSVGTTASVLFTVINRCGHCSDTPRDSTVTRHAKILYIALLESVQKERGEWQGFSSSSTENDNHDADERALLRPRDLLTSSIDQKSIADQLGLLNEVLDVSFRNLMGPLVPVDLYTRQKKVMMRQSLALPPALSTLLAIRDILAQLERDVQHCLLRLFALWDLMALVTSESQSLMKTIGEKAHHIFSDSSELDNMTARKSERQDGVAMKLLQLMVLYRDILFSDIEFILTKQELQINPRLIETSHASGWPTTIEPLSVADTDQCWSTSNPDSSCSDENQLLHDDVAPKSWGQHDSFRSRASSGPSFLDDESHDYEIDKCDWPVSWPRDSNHHDEERKALRSRMSTRSTALSGDTDPMALFSNRSSPLPSKTDLLTLDRIPSDVCRSQRSLASTLNSPTPSARSHASSDTRSTSRNSTLLTHQSKFMKGGMDRLGGWQDPTRSEVQSPPPRSRSMNRHKRTRRTRTGSASRGDYPLPLIDQSITKNAPQDQVKTKAARFLSSLVIPVATASLCVVATMTTLAIYEMRRAPRS